MARGFAAGRGVGASDIIQTGFTAHSTLRTWAIWSLRDGSGGGALGRMFDKTDANSELLYFDNSTTTYNFIRAHSVSAGTWSVPAPSGGIWHSVILAYNSSATTNNPVIYINGASATVSTVAAPSGTPTNNTSDYDVGNRSVDSGRNWDGGLAYFAIWDTLLTANEAALIALQRVHPSNIRPHKLVLFDELTQFSMPRALRIGTKPMGNPFVRPFVDGLNKALLAAQAHTTVVGGFKAAFARNRNVLVGSGATL